MSYKIIVDSCGELTEEMRASGIFETASLAMDVDDYHIIDDETFDQADFLKKVAESPNCPKSCCPSPERYMEGYRCDADRVYVVTLSAELSGSYNSAVLGANLYHEEYGDKDIYVFNSRSASIGETLIACKIIECEENELMFPEVIEKVEEYIEGQNTFFLLVSLETLRKNGRLTGLKAIAANVLNIKPVMGSTPKGEICQLGQARGMKKALQKLVDCVEEGSVNVENKVLAISHCNCPERAEVLRQMLDERLHPQQILVLDTRGISSMYANDGGVIVAV